MPRQPRLDAPGTLHHVIGRGIERVKIFSNKADREDFLNRVEQLCRGGALIVYAWALMPNHFHVLVRTGRQPLSKSMRRLLTGYVINFNLRHKRHGHLFQNRYKSIVCEEDPYLLELTRYIHLNPLRAGMVKDMSALGRYPWTGHSVLVGKVKRVWQDTVTVLSYFGTRSKEAMLHYESFVRDGISQGRRPDLVGGGLIRTLGGWAQVLSMRRKGIRVASDDRILGSGEFVGNLISEVDKREKETLRLSSKLTDLATLGRKIAKDQGLLESDLRSGSRNRRVSRIRRLYCQLAVRKMGYPAAEVARYVGVSTSAVARAASSEDLPEIDTYL
ncbi:MAG: transposase [Deltaproteobacteria bacterium]|nr:MAG: transposase [Deltaproteobacteria bacterium]